MHQLQVMELSLWLILARNFKPGIQLHQATAKIAGWDANTFGGLFGNMKNQPHWPEGLGGKLEQAIEIRNWLAHHFLREYFVVRPSEENRDRAVNRLSETSDWLDDLQEELDRHTADLGIPSDEDLEPELRAEMDATRPADWPDPGFES